MTPPPSWMPARVVALRDLSPTVREITLRPDAAAGGATPWAPGSHLRVQVVHADGRLDERRYSLVSTSPAAEPPGADWRIAVKRAEPSRGGSAFMWRLAVGDTVPVQPPHNHFELPLMVAHTLLVAGGIGITPIVGMAMALKRRKRELRMCYAARSDDELVYAGELRSALGERLATFVDARGERLDLDAEIAALPPQGQMLVCGPVPLLHATREAWARAGRPPQRLRFETFGNTGAKPAEAFHVSVPRHGIEFVVPADRSLLEMLDAQRVQVLRDCLRGECGLCAVDVTGLQGEIDHRDVFFGAEEKHTGTKLCACVSRVCAPAGAAPGSGRLVIDSFYRPDNLPPPIEETPGP